jgi:UDP-N-acetylglucosamine acyltransferase
MVQVHETAVVGARAELGEGVRVGPYAVVEDGARLGAGCEIGAHAVVKRFTTLGARNRVFDHAVLGGEPQDVSFRGGESGLVVGDDNIFREHATVHRSTRVDEPTRIGSRNFLMVGVHVAHDCQLGDDNIFANGAALAGHIRVEDHAFLSNDVGCHQFIRIGRYAMIGGKSKIVQDVLPFFTTDGNPARVRGLNTVGLRRAGFGAESRRALRAAYRVLLREGLPLDAALDALAEVGDEHVRHLVSFIRGSRRGFIRAARHVAEQESEGTADRGD